MGISYCPVRLEKTFGEACILPPRSAHRGGASGLVASGVTSIRIDVMGANAAAQGV
ncbi:MAG: hypothetical protein IT514_01690 [Burkholderiales bacterium]|nr:hypothetical protein [Burkholderiales bacterium]